MTLTFTKFLYQANTTNVMERINEIVMQIIAMYVALLIIKIGIHTSNQLRMLTTSAYQKLQMTLPLSQLMSGNQ